VATDHERAVRLARRTNKKLGWLFSQMGTADHPRGALLSSYRTARRALKGKLDKPGVVNDALLTLRAAIRGTSAHLLSRAGEIGADQAFSELALYGIMAPSTYAVPQEAMAREAVLTVLEAQEQRIYALTIGGVSGADDLILGDGVTRLGILQPAPVQRELARWITSVSMFRWIDTVKRSSAGDEFRRQAIAAIDERTTDCCLRVHGQTVKMDQPFALTGTPRYADKIMAPPFHNYCRTATTLVQRDAVDDEFSGEMRGAARDELRAREEVQGKIDALKKRIADLGQVPDIRARADDTEQVRALRLKLRAQKKQLRVEIHPAHARSKRG